MRRSIRYLGIALAAAGLPAAASADVVSDEAAAILIFPRVLAMELLQTTMTSSSETSVDTVIQISNTSTQPVDLHCFYVKANGYCSVTGSGCGTGPDSSFRCPSPADVCLPRWIETDFNVTLTPRQPLAWSAITGLSRELLPLKGFDIPGQGGSTNAGTLVPPVSLDPVRYDMLPPLITSREQSFFEGELKCVVVDETGRAIPSNTIKGEATIVTELVSTTASSEVISPRVEKYNAVGVKGIEGDANGDGVLELGGGSNEYNGCANVLIANHLFDSASYNIEPIIRSQFTLVPCTQDLRAQIPGSTTAQFLVFNEFEQRFSTSQRVDCYFRRVLSRIDTNDPGRSIFSTFVTGTFAGQTRIRGVQGGLIGVISETAIAKDIPFSADASFQFGLQGERELADRITLP